MAEFSSGKSMGISWTNIGNKRQNLFTLEFRLSPECFGRTAKPCALSSRPTRDAVSNSKFDTRVGFALAARKLRDSFATAAFWLCRFLCEFACGGPGIETPNFR